MFRRAVPNSPRTIRRSGPVWTALRTLQARTVGRSVERMRRGNSIGGNRGDAARGIRISIMVRTFLFIMNCYLFFFKAFFNLAGFSRRSSFTQSLYKKVKNPFMKKKKITSKNNIRKLKRKY